MSSYNFTIPGTLVQPSSNSLDTISISVNTQLSWPTDFQNSLTSVQSIMDVTAMVGGLKLFLPDATKVSNGRAVTINNVGVNDFSVYTFEDDSLIKEISAGSLYTIYLSDNSTIPGVWKSYNIEGGTVDSVNAVSLDGNLIITGDPALPITGTGTINFEFSPEITIKEALVIGTFANGAILIERNDDADTNIIKTIKNNESLNIKTRGTGVLNFVSDADLNLISSITGNVNLTAANGSINLTSVTGGYINLSTDLVLKSGAPLVFEDASGTHAIGFAASPLTSSTTAYSWPPEDAIVEGMPLASQGNGTLFFNSAGYLNKVVNLTSAQILALNTDPQVAIPSVGGKIIVITKWSFNYQPGLVDYNSPGPDANFFIAYDGQLTRIAASSIDQSVIGGSSPRFAYGAPISNILPWTQTSERPILITNAVGNFVDGDGIAQVVIWYSLIDSNF